MPHPRHQRRVPILIGIIERLLILPAGIVDHHPGPVSGADQSGPEKGDDENREAWKSLLAGSHLHGIHPGGRKSGNTSSARWLLRGFSEEEVPVYAGAEEPGPAYLAFQRSAEPRPYRC